MNEGEKAGAHSIGDNLLNITVELAKLSQAAIIAEASNIPDAEVMVKLVEIRRAHLRRQLARLLSILPPDVAITSTDAHQPGRRPPT